MVTSLILGLCLPLLAQDPQGRPVFRSGVNTVEVTAVVRDRQGNPVRGLTREDFVVEENGVAQDITVFSPVDVPRIRTKTEKAIAGVAPRPDVATNTVRTARSYVFVLDALSVDPARSGRVRQLAKKFINDYMYEGDSAAVVTLGSRFGNQNFTTDRARLIAAIGSFIGGKSESAAAARAASAIARDSETGVKAFNARLLFESLRRIFGSLGAVSGTRRAVVLFSEGLEIDTTDLIGDRPTVGGAAEQVTTTLPSTYAAALLAAQRAMFDAAQRANVALYTVDPRGLTIGEDILVRSRTAPALDVMREIQRSQGSLRLFANQTGGSAMVNSNDFDRGFREVIDANSMYYVLGYTTSARGAGFRKIKVRVARDGVEVTARPGYFAERPAAGSTASLPPVKIELAGASSRMQELLADPLQQAGLDVHASSAQIAVRGKDSVVAIVAELEGSALSFALDGGMLSTDIEVGLIAVDRNGKVVWSRATTGKLRFPEAERARVEKGLRLVFEAPLPPEEYQIRLAVIERSRGTAGSVVLDVDVRKKPDPGVVTGLLFMQQANDMPTTGTASILNALLPSTAPTTNRRFAASQGISVLATLPPPSSASRPARLVTLVVLRGDGREVLRLPAVSAVDQRIEQAEAACALIEVPAGALDPGSYQLRVVVRDGGKNVTSAPISFSVER